MRVVLIAPAVNGAMGYHVEALSTSITKAVKEYYLFVPMHYAYDAAKIVRYPVPKSQRGKLLCYLNPIWARQRYKEILSLQPDLCHLFNSEGYPSSVLWSRWLYRETRIPLIVSIHDPEPHPGSVIASVNYRLGRKTVRYSNAIHIFSRNFTKNFTREGWDASNIYVIPLPTDVHKFTQYKKVGISRESMILFFGRLEPYKGIEVLVESAKYLPEQYRIVIAGPGNLSKTTLQKIRSNPQRFELRNYFLHESEVANLFQRASVCVMPYIQATQSSVPLLSAAFEVPLVATRTGGISYQCERIGGVLVPPNEPKALAEGIMEAVGKRVTLPPEWHPDQVASLYIAMYHSVYQKHLALRKNYEGLRNR